MRAIARCAAAAGVSLAAAVSLAAPAAVAGPVSRQPGRHAGHGQARPGSRSEIGGLLLASPGIVVRYPSRAAPRLPRVPASAYVIADAGSGAVLAAKDPHGLYPPASTLKVLTAIALIPVLRPDAVVRASRLATSVQPNIVGLVRGRRYRVADLMRALLMTSANDAAVALAQATGSYDHGIALMTALARRLRAYDVVVRNPNGLPATAQVTSAYDEALIARQALAMPAFMSYDSDLAASFPLTPRRRITLVNQNGLLTGFRGGIGGKIGWTVKAEATYIGLARRHGVTLIVTILHCTPLQEITAAERLLSWGFAEDGRIKPVGVLVPPVAARAAQPGVALPPAARPPAPASQAARPRAGGTAPGRAATALAGLSSRAAAAISVAAGCVAMAGLAVAVAARLRRRRRL